MVECRQCRNVFQQMGDAFNARADTAGVLESAARSLVEQFALKGCHFRLLSRDQQILESVASYGLSDEFLNKGPVDAERSVAECLEGNVVMIEDCGADPRIQYPREMAKEGIASLLTVPLKTRGQVIGVMRLFTSEERSFSAEEVELFRVTALFCTSAIIHSMFHRILSRVSAAVQSTLEIDEVLNSTVRVVAEELRVKGCSLQLFESKAGELNLKASYGLSRRFLTDGIEKADGPAVAAALEGECVCVVDCQKDPRIVHRTEAIHEGFASALFIPLMSRTRAMGVLTVYTHKSYSFSEEEQQVMMAIGEQCSLAIQNAQMYAAIKSRYNTVVDDFQLWFEHYHTHPQGDTLA